MSRNLYALVTTGILLGAQFVSAQDHGHLNVGATGTDQNTKLIFQNGSAFATDHRYIKTLTFTNAGRYAGYYQQNITLTVLPATDAFGGPDPQAPAAGSHIFAQIVSAEGPQGGAFNFWEAGAVGPTITIEAGTTDTNVFKLSQGDGSPGLDPFGHIHQRRFTATKPGIYTIGFRALDLSTNGTAGGPIHLPSDVLKIYFQAGVNIASIKRAESANAITFGAPLNLTLHLEGNTNLSTSNWTQIDSIAGTDLLETLVDTDTGTQKFYRIRAETP
jgi:hypothetical protein